MWEGIINIEVVWRKEEIEGISRKKQVYRGGQVEGKRVRGDTQTDRQIDRWTY